MRGVAVAIFAALAIATLAAHAPSGAIFTTVADGSEVNYNIYAAKEDVYLDGGPGPGAPQHAAGLDDGTYVFQVTDPSGKTLLSTDAARCRQIVVSAGIITGVVDVGGCQHVTGNDIDHPPAKTVQLMPYDDTPNPGGEYKVWVTFLDDFPAACLAVVDCGPKVKGNAHGFVPRHSKTDNFKVRGSIREIDTRFFDRNGNILDGLGITWTDTLGASNNKWSYENLALDIHHEAHVEAVEDGDHKITIENQAGCTVGSVYVAGVLQRRSGPQTVTVNANNNWPGDTVFIDVYCQ
jgi:Uncharacterized protein conserved in bacteria